jgi:hypothetical protein
MRGIFLLPAIAYKQVILGVHGEVGLFNYLFYGSTGNTADATGSLSGSNVLVK